MIKRENPVGLTATPDIPINKDLEDDIKKLHYRIQGAEQDRNNWLTKQRLLIEQRRGIRQPKVIPWVGANNDNWPVTDAVIRRWKPGIVSLILDSEPVAFFFAKQAEQVEASRVTQDFWHWEFNQIEGVERTIFKLADLVALHGLAYTHEGWDYHIERKCRVVRADSLFPGGIEAALNEVNSQIEQANAQAAQQGGEQQPFLQPDEFVRMTLQMEYEFGNVDQDPNPAPVTVEEDRQLDAATQMLLNGAKYIQIFYHCVARDKVAWQAISPLDVIVPTRTTDPEKADFVAIAYRLHEDDIRVMVRDGVFLAQPAQIVLDRMRPQRQGEEFEENPFDSRQGGSRSAIIQRLDTIEGIETRNSHDEPGTEVFWKVYSKLDINGDKILEKTVLWYHPATATPMSLVAYPFPFEEWPVTLYEFEHNDDRPYSSRGIAELLSTFQKQVNRLHNARLDAIQILLAPMFKVRSVTGQINRNIRFRPGSFIPVQSPDDFQPVQMDITPLFQFLQEENFTKQLAEQYVGVFDSSVVNLQSNERRTATEVEAINAQVSSVFTQDAKLFRASFARTTKKLWKLWQEFGPEDVMYRVTGEDVPRTAKKYEIDYDYDIEPSGTPANTNKALALSRAREALSLGLQDQSGVLNKSELWKNYFQLTDRHLAKRVVRSPEEAAAVQMVMNAAAQSQDIDPSQVPSF